MWPGQQQPGGEPNPQGQNPYQQPGYQQPNPYQQPGYQQPNPYQQPADQWGQPGGPGGPQPPKGGKTSRNVVIAIVASVAVIAAAVVTGVVVLSGDEDDKGNAASDKDSPSAKPSPSESEPEDEDDGGGREPDPDSPRGGDDEEVPDPVVSGWQVVVNPKHFSAFDVPKGKDWEIQSKTTIVGWGEKKDDDALIPTPQVAMSAPAVFKDGWCTEDSSRAVVGTKGAQGAKSSKEAALNAAQSFAYYAYNENKENLKWTKSKAFSNKHGIKGHTATATMTGVKKESKCDTDGKVVTVSWLDKSRELRLWVLVTDAGVKDEVPDATIKKMMDSLRPYNEQD